MAENRRNPEEAFIGKTSQQALLGLFIAQTERRNEHGLR